MRIPITCRGNRSNDMSKYKPTHIACTPPFIATVICIVAATFAPTIWTKVVFLLLSIIFLFDTGARYREYILLVNKGAPWNGRDIKYFRSSLCRRWAAIQAGMNPEIFRQLGYRKWHILPDGFPACFFKIGFWRNLLGLKKPLEK